MNYTEIYPLLPNKKYDIIYADCPWSYRDLSFRSGNNTFHGAKDQYPTLDLEQLKLLPVQDIAENDCLIFLWATGPNLDVAIELLSYWKFKYITVGFVWEKNHVNAGHYTLSTCEFCLIGKKGKIPQPRGARNIRQFLQEKRTVHSKKPVEIRKRIEHMFPNQSKIELFARRSFDDQWDVWGNQVKDENSNLTLF